MNDLEQMAIERLKAASDMSLMAYQQPLVICISGGKDSGVITELAVRSGIPCEFLHSHTTAGDVFRWWMEYDVLPGQTSMEDYLEMMDE